jgi:hypothetical protein
MDSTMMVDSASPDNQVVKTNQFLGLSSHKASQHHKILTNYASNVLSGVTEVTMAILV